MEKFIKNHPRLYWVIVVTLAIVAFSVITCVGLGKLEKAEASQAMSPQSAEKLAYSEFVKVMGNEGTEGYPYYTVINASNSRYYVIYTQSPMNCVDAPTAKPGSHQYTYYIVSDDYCYFFYVEKNSGAVTNATSENNRGVYSDNADVVVLTNYALKYGETPLFIPTLYDLSSSYVRYEKVNVVNRFAEKDYLASVFTDIYEVYTSGSKWEYTGVLENFDVDKNASYKLEVDFKVELPTESYIEQQYADANIDLEWEHNVIKSAPNFIYAWYNDDNAPVREFSIKYTFDIAPDSNGRFAYSLTFSEIETLLMYFDEAFRAHVQECSPYWRAVVMSYVHIDTVSTVVKTSTDTSITYGKGVINIFERGIYNACVQIAPDVDYSTMTEEEIDALIKEAVDTAYDEYLKDLEQKVEDLQGQVDNMTGTLGNFDSAFDGNTLWGAVKSLGSGLLGMSGFITSFAVVLGSFFVFLPYDVQACVGYLFIIALVVVLWRLLKK